MPDFGATPYLSLFPAPAENPLSEGGKWRQTLGERPPLQKDTPGHATDSIHGDPNYSHWAAEVFDSNDSEGIVEVWGCLNGGQLGAALETWRVALWSTIGDDLSGYLVYYGGGIGKGYSLRRYDGGVTSFTALASAGGGYPDRLGLRVNGSEVEAWGYSGSWSLMCSATDTTYRGGFRLGLGIEDPTGGGLSFVCFGGGVPRRTQFFRWTRGFKEPAAE